MKLLYGTGNLAKLSAMRNRLEQFDIELIGLNDLRVEGKIVPKVIEIGSGRNGSQVSVRSTYTLVRRWL